MINLIKRRKAYIIVIIILIVYFAIMYYFGSKNASENKKRAYIVINGISSWQYEDATWEYLYNYNDINNKKKFKIYLSNKYVGDYKIRVNNNKIYAFDSDNNSLQYNEDIIAINSNYNVELKDISLSNYTEEDDDILNDIIEEYNIYNFRNKKLIVDLDNDGKNEAIYIVNCYNSKEAVFSGIYLYNGKLQQIIRSEDLDYITYNVESLIDIDNDNKYELLISSNLSNNKSYKIYKQKRNKYIEFLN